MSQPRPIQEVWEAFAAHFVNPLVQQEQYEAMRDAFFAGAYAMFEIVNGATDEGVSDAAAFQVLSFVSDELRDFADEKGRK